MIKQLFHTNKFNDAPIIDIIEVASTLFFTCMLMFSVFLMSAHAYKNGFTALAVASVYFIANNTIKLKFLKATTWLVIFGFAVKGAMGV